MKTLMQNFRQLILVGLITFLTTSQSVGQVVTRVLSPDDQVQNYMPWYNPDDKIVELKTPIVDVEAVLEDDERIGRELPRIGIKQEVQFNTSNGILSQSGNFTTWRLDLSNEDAKSLKFRMSLKAVPDDFILYFYNEEYNFLVGPIKSKNFNNSNYISDYIPGNKVSIILFSPDDEIEIKEDDIVINNIYLGLETTYAFDSAFETSLPCNINVACDEGIGWDCQISSVCKIITGDGACTGSLMNNDCCDLTPYILTADHCLRDIFGGLNDFGSYTYRFNYQSPRCDPNEEPNPSQWIVFSGSQLRSNWNGTDFGLLELFEEGVESISYAGWNREANPPTNEVTCIHHPAGDVKKIAVNTDGIGTQGNFWLIEQFEAGLVEPGSSGSPLFDANGLVIGDLSGGDLNFGCDGDHGLADNNTFGQFSISWNGGGSANSRLRDWLGASTSPVDLECLEEYPTITGPDIICDGSGTYILTNNMPCVKSIAWSVTPTYLFSSPTSGIGNNATLTKALGNYNAEATITFTLSSPNCDDIEISHEFRVGGPEITIYGQDELCIGDFGNAWAFVDGGYSSIQWFVYGSVAPMNNTSSGQAYIAVDDGPGGVCAKITHACGVTTKCLDVWVEDCRGDNPWDLKGRSVESPNSDILVYPNPANDIINIVSNEIDTNTKVSLSLYSSEGREVKHISSNGNNHRIHVNQLSSGFYILKFDTQRNTIYKKILIQ